MICNIKEYKFQYVDTGLYTCSVYNFIYSKKWVVSYTMPYYKPQWYDNIDPTKENFLEPLPTIPNYKLNIEFINGIPKVSTSYNGPNIYFNFISSYSYTTFAESGIASQFEEYCQTPLTPIIHIKPSIKILYIILIVVGGVAAILLLSLMIWFFIKKYRGST